MQAGTREAFDRIFDLARRECHEPFPARWTPTRVRVRSAIERVGAFPLVVRAHILMPSLPSLTSSALFRPRWRSI
jgi:hypothetical protein